MDNTQPAPTQTPETNPPAAVQTSEDELLQSATENLSDEQQPQLPPQELKPKKSHKGLLLVLLVLIAAGAGAYWYFMMREKPAPAPAVDTPAAVEEHTGHIPDTVAYAFRTKDKDPFSLFWRPAAGGDRTEVTQLPDKAYAFSQNAHGANIAFVADDKVYVSTDAGKSYKSIFSPEAGEYVNNVKLSSSGNELAVAVTTHKDAELHSMDLDGQNSKELFSDNNAIYVDAWDPEIGKLIYTTGCFQCDGPRSAPKIRDLAKKTSTELVKGMSAAQAGNFEVTDDLTKVVYVENTVDEDIVVEGPPFGYYVGAPYTINLLEVTTGKSEEIATVGKKQEKNANGTDKYRNVVVGFEAGVETNAEKVGSLYYTDDNKLYSASYSNDDNSLLKPPHLLYQASDDILNVPYVGGEDSETTVIASHGDITGNDYALVNYNTAEEKATTIFEGDGNTVLLGVTTK